MKDTRISKLLPSCDSLWLFTNVFMIIFTIIISCEGKSLETDDFKLLNTFTIPYPAFTQGYMFDEANDRILESAGGYKKSMIRSYSLDQQNGTAGLPITLVKNSDDIFAEGLAKLGDKYFQLTWMNKKVYIYDLEFKLLDTKPLPKEMKKSGWGLTSDGEMLYATSGTDIIFELDPETLECNSMIKAKLPSGNPLYQLNECQIVEKSMYCNKFQDTKIYKLNYKTGITERIYELRPLLELVIITMNQKVREMGNSYKWNRYDHANNVLNGIAYNPTTRTFYLTGKMWYFMFEVELKS